MHVSIDSFNGFIHSLNWNLRGDRIGAAENRMVPKSGSTFQILQTMLQKSIGNASKSFENASKSSRNASKSFKMLPTFKTPILQESFKNPSTSFKIPSKTFNSACQPFNNASQSFRTLSKMLPNPEKTVPHPLFQILRNCF